MTCGSESTRSRCKENTARRRKVMVRWSGGRSRFGKEEHGSEMDEICSWIVAGCFFGEVLMPWVVADLQESRRIRTEQPSYIARGYPDSYYLVCVEA